MSLANARKRRIAAWHRVLPLLMASICGVPTRSSALEPPTPGEIAEMKRAGTYGSYLDNAKRLGNHRMDPVLLKKAINRGKRAVLQEQGFTAQFIDGVAPLYAPPPAWHGMPTRGNVKVLALLVEFKDQRHVTANTLESVQSSLFGAGDPARFPYDSLTNYYARASYNQLALSGNALGWYRTNYDRPETGSWTDIVTRIVEEAIGYYDKRGHDFAQYDSDNDGFIDYFAVIWSGPQGSPGTLWWAWESDFAGYDSTFTVDGKKLGKFSWQWETAAPGGTYTPRIVSHEIGHALGLPDLYDYDDTIGPRGGVGGLDMMDHEWGGDHNCFSKWMLDWVTPTFVSSGTNVIHLQPLGTAPNCVVIWPGANPGELFSEFFVAENRQRVGNDVVFPGDGMTIWHVDATLNESGLDFAYDNSYTAHKLVRLMEADGLEEIEQNILANAGDYWTSGRSFGPSTIPSSRRYDGTDPGVRVYGFSNPGGDMYATFAISANPTGIAMSANHACAIVNGGARCWGYNYSGQLGDGTTVNSSVPVQVSGLTSGVQAVVTGELHSCALVNGGVKCWGRGYEGQLGNGAATSSYVPVPVSGLTSGVQAIAAGGSHTCALVNGGAKCWGENYYGQLGSGGSTSDSPLPVDVYGLWSGVQAIAAGGTTTCAIVNGGAMCWGANSYGEVGDNSTTLRRTPVPVYGLGSGVQAMSTSAYHHTCAVAYGAVKCWGFNFHGQLGNGNTTNSSVPVQVYGLTSGAQRVAAGGWHSCAAVNSAMTCWGYNDFGQLGDGTLTERLLPVQVYGLTSSVQAAAAGYETTCAIVNGVVKCWGYGRSGQLGNGAFSDSQWPVAVVGL